MIRIYGSLPTDPRSQQVISIKRVSHSWLCAVASVSSVKQSLDCIRSRDPAICTRPQSVLAKIHIYIQLRYSGARYRNGYNYNRVYTLNPASLSECTRILGWYRWGAGLIRKIRPVSLAFVPIEPIIHTGRVLNKAASNELSPALI